jgi:hypothetical protein
MTGIGLAISDTLMYQRGEPEPSDPAISSLYGLAMPLVKHGVALDMVQLERVADPGYLENVQLLLLTYEGQKPPSVMTHQILADWVRDGNVLLLYGTGDAYDDVRAWWNEEGAAYARPQNHLTELLGVGRRAEPGSHRCGRGHLIVVPSSPAALARDPAGAQPVLESVAQARDLLCQDWTPGNHLVLRRGPYVVAAGMDEVEGGTALVLGGSYVNLYDPALSVVADPSIAPDSRWLLYDLSRCPHHPWVIAAAGRVVDEAYDESSLTFTVEGIAETTCAVRIRLPAPPESVTADGETVEAAWDGDSQTALVRFPNAPDGVSVEVTW